VPALARGAEPVGLGAGALPVVGSAGVVGSLFVVLSVGVVVSLGVPVSVGVAASVGVVASVGVPGSAGGVPVSVDNGVGASSPCAMGAATRAAAKPAAPNLTSRAVMLRAGDDGSSRGERMVVLPLGLFDAPPTAMLSSGYCSTRMLTAT
jgi:hypothetical protein